MNDILLPTPERMRRGVELVPDAIADIDGRLSQPHRAIDILAALHKRGAISKEMWIAGDRFRMEFSRAQLDPLQAADLSRPMVSGRMRTPVLASRIEDARESVWQAVRAAGGLGSAGGSCLWYVLGWERSLKEWAMQQGWSGRRVSREAASGILTAALGALCSYYENNP